MGTYLVPMALPLLLFKANIREIAKNSGRLLILFLLSACGTMLGSVIAFFTVGRFIPEVGKFLAMITGSYIGCLLYTSPAAVPACQINRMLPAVLWSRTGAENVNLYSGS